MERLTKKRLIEILNILINEIENGLCDDLSEEEYDKIINSLITLRDVKNKEYDNNRINKRCIGIDYIFNLLSRK